jgi:preprotein translocase subunit YajC
MLGPMLGTMHNLRYYQLLISPAYAQAAGAQPSPYSPLIMLAVFFAVFFFFVIRPQMKRAKDHRNMIAAMGKGDEVVTSGGILGRVEDIGDAFITVEISDGVRIKLQKHAITAVLPKGTLKTA